MRPSSWILMRRQMPRLQLKGRRLSRRRRRRKPKRTPSFQRARTARPQRPTGPAWANTSTRLQLSGWPVPRTVAPQPAEPLPLPLPLQLLQQARSRRERQASGTSAPGRAGRDVPEAQWHTGSRLQLGDRGDQ